MSIFGKIGDFFKKVGHLIKAAFVALFGSEFGSKLADAAEAFLKTELGKIALSVVSGLEQAAGAPADKRDEAFKQIAAELERQGKSFPSSVINFAIEFALRILRGSQPPTQ